MIIVKSNSNIAKILNGNTRGYHNWYVQSILSNRNMYEIQKTITKADLQKIFDDNGLDSYSVNSKFINITTCNEVIVDSRLISYLAPWSCVVNHI